MNEDNVDLNPNFVDWSDRPHNEAYGEIADLLVPAAWNVQTREWTTAAILEVADVIGFERLQES